MRLQILRDAKGQLLASADLTEDPNAVPVEAEAEGDNKLEEIQISRRELFDLPQFYRKRVKK